MVDFLTPRTMLLHEENGNVTQRRPWTLKKLPILSSKLKFPFFQRLFSTSWSPPRLRRPFFKRVSGCSMLCWLFFLDRFLLQPLSLCLHPSPFYLRLQALRPPLSISHAFPSLLYFSRLIRHWAFQPAFQLSHLSSSNLLGRDTPGSLRRHSGYSLPSSMHKSPSKLMTGLWPYTNKLSTGWAVTTPMQMFVGTPRIVWRIFGFVPLR